MLHFDPLACLLGVACLVALSASWWAWEWFGTAAACPPLPGCDHDWRLLHTEAGSGMRCKLCGKTETY
jgi:hypothetical protein